MNGRIAILVGLIALFTVILVGSTCAVDIRDAVAIWLFDEEDEELVLESTGNGNNGQIINGTEWVADGKFGGALLFDGLDDYVEIPASESSKWVSRI